MAYIKAKNVSVTFPLVGSDSRHGKRAGGSGASGSRKDVGGAIVRDEKGRSGIRALDGLNLDLRAGDRLGIFGHNGAGKSTLLRVLAGIYPPTSGDIEIDGHVSGMFSLNLGVNKEATGYENIELKGLMYGLKRREIRQLMPEIAEFSELGDYLKMPVKTYSSGMVMRLLFATSSALKPDILLLDEWISSGDTSFKEKVDKRLNEMLEVTPIVVIASHNKERLRGWATKVLTLSAGRVIDYEDIEQSASVPIAPVKFSPNPDALARYQYLMNFKKFEDALDTVGAVWPIGVAPALHLSARAALLSRMKRHDEAIEALEEVVALAPDNLKFKDQLGRALMKTSRFEEAASLFEASLSESSGKVGHIDSFIQVCDILETPERAERVLSAISQIYTDFS